MGRKKSGLTLVEILVVVGIIALLTGILIPAISMVQKSAKEAKEKAQLTAIELGLEAFKNDFGDYPESDSMSYKGDAGGGDDLNASAGAMKLSEAMVGWDLLGFHPDSGWRVDGRNRWPYQVGTTTNAPGTYWLYDRNNAAELAKRKGRYVDLDVANPFQLGVTTAPDGVTPPNPDTVPLPHDGLYDLRACAPCDKAADCYVLCDVFGKGKQVALSNGTRRAGRPILYYRANPAYKIASQTYSYQDNSNLLYIIETNDTARMGGKRPDGSLWNPLEAGIGFFATVISDPRASTTGFPVAYKPDSYILISAGADGLYGTNDDIHNFGR